MKNVFGFAKKENSRALQNLPPTLPRVQQPAANTITYIMTFASINALGTG